MTVIAMLTDPEESRPALDWALDFATAHQTDLRVVLSGRDRPGAPVFASPHKLHELRAHLAGAAVTATVEDLSADPPRQVIELADELDAAVVVIGLRARSHTSKIMLGSFARDVIVHAEMPVVVVKNLDH